MIWTAAGLYALWRVVVRPLLRAACLLLRAIALLFLAVGGVRVTAARVPPPAPEPDPGEDDQSPPSLGHPVSTAGDWRADRETLRRLLAEGQIK